ncbi:MAG TPA: SMP-30/gluconolactonase/LRE family protein [Usitatibacter sp.]
MKKIALAVLFLALVAPALAQQDDAGVRRSIAVVQETLKQRPNDATLHFFLARFQAELGDAPAATASLEKVAELGDGFLPARDLGFAKVWDDAKFQEVRSRLEARLPRLDYAPVAMEIEDNGLLPEGIAYDAPSRSFFMGSIAKGKIIRIDADSVVKDFANRLDPVLGIAVDSPRRVLYAISTSALTEAGRKDRRNAVLSYDIDNGRLIRRVDIPSAVGLNDVTVARGGRVFASDSGNGAVYEILREGAPRVLVPEGQVRGSNGLAASPDAKRLYVAHTTGIVVVDVATGAVKRVGNATRETIAAIDGLYEWQGELVGVQNVTNPGRVILMTLAKDGDSVVRVRTLLSHHHNRLDEPTTGAIRDSDFMLLAATGTSRFNAKGAIDDPATVPKPTIVKVLLPR